MPPVAPLAVEAFGEKCCGLLRIFPYEYPYEYKKKCRTERHFRINSFISRRRLHFFIA